MMRVLKDKMLWLALALYWLLLGLLLVVSLRMNAGHYTYALDDAYIHMAIAKNMAQTGVWGVTAYEFSSTSSSLLWTATLAALYRLLSVNEWLPLAMNVVASSLLLVTADAIFLRERVTGWVRLLALAALVLFPSLPALSLTGQEHVLHGLISIGFAYTAAVALAAEPRSVRDRRQQLWPLLLAPLVPLIRYEGLFLVLVFCILFALRKRFLYAIALGLLALAPVVAYGLFSVSQGWYLLPNSVLLKGNLPELTSLRGIVKAFFHFVQQTTETSHILVLLVIALAVLYFRWRQRQRLWEPPQIMLLAFVPAALLHMQFSSVGPLYRYDAYLVVLGIVAAAAGLGDLELPRVRSRDMALGNVMLALLIAFLILPLAKRGGHSLVNVPLASNNIYEQQYQMGQFVRRYYQGQGVAANDIGAVNFFGEIRGFDLWGLGSLGPAQARHGRRYSTEEIDRLTQEGHVQIAIVYDEWFDVYGGLPERWQRLGEWSLRENVLSGVKTVAFYAVEPTEARPLAAHLAEFAPSLPPTVSQSGSYVEPAGN